MAALLAKKQQQSRSASPTSPRSPSSPGRRLQQPVASDHPASPRGRASGGQDGGGDSLLPLRASLGRSLGREGVEQEMRAREGSLDGQIEAVDRLIRQRKSQQLLGGGGDGPDDLQGAHEVALGVGTGTLPLRGAQTSFVLCSQVVPQPQRR